MDKPVSEMVERVARAIWNDREQHQHPRTRQTWEQGSDLARRFAMDHAIAAIKAMREPTDKMMSEADWYTSQASDALGGSREPLWPIGTANMREGWIAAIDAALGDTNAA